MIGDIVVLTPDDYKKWLAESTSGMSLAQNGERFLQASAAPPATTPGPMRADQAWQMSTGPSWLYRVAAPFWPTTLTCASRS